MTRGYVLCHGKCVDGDIRYFVPGVYRHCIKLTRQNIAGARNIKDFRTVQGAEWGFMMRCTVARYSYQTPDAEFCFSVDGCLCGVVELFLLFGGRTDGTVSWTCVLVASGIRPGTIRYIMLLVF